MTPIRVGTYNVRSMYDDNAALARVIRAMAPDVLCVQEAPRLLAWRARRARLARAAGLRLVTGRRWGGVAVLAAPGTRVVHAESHLLRPFAGMERRGVAMAVVERGDARITAVSIHLDLVQGARVCHVAEIMSLAEPVAARFGAPLVIAGDVNEQPGGAVWRYLARRLADCYPLAPRGDGLTFPSGRPGMRLDVIFTAGGVSVRSCGGVDAPAADLAAATDHLPVVAELLAG
ncbi:endonuclease/exonuclease/phosphatase family protein [Sphaerisporangium sp. TRM90804]|uniref:endonuclease/exonuclease/phosphatase family protein n=1 Tax=Sphaerisporangium sp. TRM90804 TaxID=3031113 RepID=UPI00244BA15D|nr:endonuclease/exonuclease/phosphatase family protein [Sphaerisporangium sp. TRM90804]MDH2424545.1 endonuclease/exonuclease/phosphatase family protein [Sphaerisporangium sp. TRM90804]